MTSSTLPAGSTTLIVGTALVLISVAFIAVGGDARLAAAAPALALAGGVAVVAPTLGMIGAVVVIAANVSDNLIVAFGAPSLAKLMVPGLFGVLAARWLLRGDPPFLPLSVLVVFAAFLGATGLSLAAARNWVEADETLVDTFKDMVVAVMILAHFRTPDHLRLFTAAIVTTLVVLCALGATMFVLGRIDDTVYGFSRFRFDTARFAGPIDDPNFFGALLALALPMAMRRLLLPHRPLDVAWGAVTCALLLAGLLLTHSRGGLLAAMVGGAAFTLLLDRRTVLRLGVTVCALTLIIIAYLSDALLERFQLIFVVPEAGAAQDVAIEGRLASWSVAWRLFLEHPLLGVGAGNYNLHFQETALKLDLIFRGEGRSAHSLYLEISAETGVVGMIAFLLILAMGAYGLLSARLSALMRGARAEADEFGAFAAAMTAYLTAMIFLHDSYPRLLWTSLAVAVAAPALMGPRRYGKECAPRSDLGMSPGAVKQQEAHAAR